MPIRTKSIRRTLDDLIRRVWKENLRLKASGLVTMTWGNVSGIDRRRGIVVIKPSGMDYDALRPADMVLTDLEGCRLQPGCRFQPMACPFILVANHAPFAWGATPSAAVENAIVLEAISKMALLTILLDSPRRSLRRSLGGRRTGISQALLDKHYLRKHGSSAYYGQAKYASA